MKTAEFNENYSIDRKARGVKATAKNAESAFLETPKTADGTNYDAETIYYFFDEASREVRASTGFRRTGEHLCAFGLKVVEVAKLHTDRDSALSDGQTFFKSEIERLQNQIQKYELEKTGENRSLKTFLMAKE